ncbi:hypothetical protein BT93_H1215 [Corymbia citriodora subsp. variegata]|nr:hypothetical protein BT93_H1215 [Corymbia citriodora subsp. variegata]
MSSSSSSSSEAKRPFDVFFCFRGEDFRHSFLADLHGALLHRGINAYVDREDLRPGDQISLALTKAIEESRVAVLVFSENYASSRSCLDELTKVMECKRLKGQMVLPVFYKVEPRDIRWQRESYGKALARHEERLGKDSERKTLLSEIIWKQKLVFSSVDRGADMIRERLCRKKILLVLDDVNHGNQLNALARECEWFGKGSRIIITTRDKHVLTSHGMDHIYEVEPLDRGEAFELLSSYAFPRNQMEDISRHHIDNILDYANGLPLAIVVLGPFLCGRSGGEWECTLEKLAESPNKYINSVLKISFDALEDNEKDIFLDIACFFKGRKRDYVTRVLNSCGLKASIGIPVLIERSLVTIDNERNVQMNNLIQLMGQDIVKRECPDDPGRRSRLWCYDDVLEVLSKDTGTTAVMAIVLDLRTRKELYISPSAFTHMRRLKVLILLCAQISGGPVCLPNDLRWLEWPECPFSTLKFGAGPKKLVCFDVRYGRIKEFGENLKDFIRLKFINLSGCQSLVRMPDLSCTPNLEELRLSRCKNLEYVDDSNAYHPKLQLLYLGECSKLQRFPDIPNKNKSLREVYLERTSIEELPTSIENLVSLQKIYLFECKKLAIVPSSIYRLPNLQCLQLEGCSKLIKFPKKEDLSDPRTKTGFPMLQLLNLAECNLSELEFLENFSCFPHLQSLNLSGNNFTNLPTCEKLYHLDSLDVSNCQQLQEIPKIPGKLTKLLASSCKSLSRIPSNICNVEIVELHSCQELVRNGFSVNDWVKLEHFHPMMYGRVILPGREMPKWLLPSKEGCISFVASKDLYKKFLRLAFCVVFRVKQATKSVNFELLAFVNGKRTMKDSRTFSSVDSDHVWLEYHDVKLLWEGDALGPNDASRFQFIVTASGGGIVEKYGFQLICKTLDNYNEEFSGRIDKVGKTN